MQLTVTTWTAPTEATGKASTQDWSRANGMRMTEAPAPRFSVELAPIRGSGANLMRVTSTGHAIDVTDEGSLSLQLPLAGALEMEANGERRRSAAGETLLVGPSRRKTLVKPESGVPFQAYLLKFPVAALGPGGTATDRAEGAFIATRPGAAAATRDLIAYVLRDLRSADPVFASDRAEALLDALLLEHVRAILSPLSRGRNRDGGAARRVLEAEDFMRAHFQDPLTVGMIAAAVGIGPRQLQADFQRERSTSPREWLTAIRLEQARIRLLVSGRGLGVTTVALDCGFAHLGRFSRIYRDRFGELPSETLRSRR